MVEVWPGEVLYNCLGPMLVGRSRTSEANHRVVSEVLRRTCGHSHSELVQDLRPSQEPQLGRLWVGDHADNFLIFALCFTEAEVCLCAVFAELYRLGIMLHELRPPTDDLVFDYLGADSAEGGRGLRPCRSRVWRLYLALLRLAALPHLHWKFLRVVL